MSTYSVRLPICGYLMIEVEADSEEAAIEAACASDYGTEHIEEWSAYTEIVRGNVFHGPVNRADAVLVEE